MENKKKQIFIHVCTNVSGKPLECNTKTCFLISSGYMQIIEEGYSPNILRWVAQALFSALSLTFEHCLITLIT